MLRVFVNNLEFSDIMGSAVVNYLVRHITVVNDRPVYACTSTSTGAIKQHGLVNRDGLIHIRCIAVADTPRTNTLHLPHVYSINPTSLAKDSALAQLRTDLDNYNMDVARL